VVSTTRRADGSFIVAGQLLVVEDVAHKYGISRRTVHEYTRRDAIPHRVLPGGRRCLFEPEALQAWEDGAELERVDLHGGGRIVRPKDAA
jgi:predicted DNA-binding transcriptional regulator AlpA